MNAKDIKKLKNEILFTNEAAEFLNISSQRLNKMVHDGKIEPLKHSSSGMVFLKQDLMKIGHSSRANSISKTSFKFNTEKRHIKGAITYFTIQSILEDNDRKTQEFINIISEKYEKDDNYINNIISELKVSETEFQKVYYYIESYFKKLPENTIIINKKSEEYPKTLLEIDNSPYYLFMLGDMTLLNEKSVCVVGSRNASEESMKQTEKLIEILVERNVVVNAGLAKGIDTATHKTALNLGGKTIAVLGTPINKYYPKENKELQIEIEKKGLVISQYPPHIKTERWHFPLRNSTMSGISQATVIMEAGETSGALIQADYALKQNKKVLIPNKVYNDERIKWPKRYFERGALIFSNTSEILKKLSDVPELHNKLDLEI